MIAPAQKRPVTGHTIHTELSVRISPGADRSHLLVTDLEIDQ